MIASESGSLTINARSGDRSDRSARWPVTLSLRGMLLAFALLVSPIWLYADDATAPVTADVLLKDGRIVDGTGDPAVEGDVAIREGKIVAVGQFEVARADWIINCSGMVIAPGFIDLHTHCDSGLVNNRTRGNVNYLTQGCTTVVTGNCGGGPVEVDKFYETLKSHGIGTNAAHLIPQGSVRREVMGTENRPATTEEIDRMKKLVDQGMRDGAWGMSTGLIYVPSSYADTDELVELAKVVATHGGIYASHIRNEGTGLLKAVQEALDIGERAELPVHISHFKSSGRDAWGLVLQAAEMIDREREQGLRATADQYPYAASSTSLSAMIVPTWARAGGRKELAKRLAEINENTELHDAIANNLKKRNGGESLMIARSKEHPQWNGKRLTEVAELMNKPTLEAAVEILQEEDPSMVNFSMNEQDVQAVMKIEWVATGSDGGARLPGPDRPHPRSYGTFPRKIGRFALREHVLSVEQAVRSASGLPADILGLKDRGYLKAGLAADIVVFDPEQFLDQATFEDPHQYSTGAVYVFVNGVPAVAGGTPTGALAGQPLVHPSAVDTTNPNAVDQTNKSTTQD